MFALMLAAFLSIFLPSFAKAKPAPMCANLFDAENLSKDNVRTVEASQILSRMQNVDEIWTPDDLPLLRRASKWLRGRTNLAEQQSLEAKINELELSFYKKSLGMLNTKKQNLSQDDLDFLFKVYFWLLQDQKVELAKELQMRVINSHGPALSAIDEVLRKRSFRLTDEEKYFLYQESNFANRWGLMDIKKSIFDYLNSKEQTLKVTDFPEFEATNGAAKFLKSNTDARLQQEIFKIYSLIRANNGHVGKPVTYTKTSYMTMTVAFIFNKVAYRIIFAKENSKYLILFIGTHQDYDNHLRLH